MGAWKGYVPGVGRTTIASKGATGDAGLTYEGAWDVGTTYAVTDWVTHDDGSSYACILPSTNNEPPNATYWAVLAAKGDQGIQGDTGDTGATGAVGADGIYSGYVCVRDVKSSGSHGGTFTSGAWRTRALTAEQADDDALCSLSSNQITLSAGTYRCLISCPAYDVDGHQARLYNTTGSALVLTGSNCYNWATDAEVSRSVIVGQFTIAASQALEVQHRCETSKSTAGFGVALSLGEEVYTQAEFWKVA